MCCSAEATDWPKAVTVAQYVNYTSFLLEHAIDLMGLSTHYCRSEWGYWSSIRLFLRLFYVRSCQVDP